MTGRLWCPADWVDEMAPALGETPDAFLKRGEDGVLRLVPLDPEPEEDFRPRAIGPGEVVEFIWTESRGSTTLTVLADGSWSSSHVFDADTTHFWLPGDIESLADSLEDLVRGDEGFRAPLAPGAHEVEGYVWSDAVPFRVEVLESGAARFVEVAS